METSTTLILLRDNNPVRMPVTQYKTLQVLQNCFVSNLASILNQEECGEFFNVLWDAPHFIDLAFTDVLFIYLFICL